MPQAAMRITAVPALCSRDPLTAKADVVQPSGTCHTVSEKCRVRYFPRLSTHRRISQWWCLQPADSLYEDGASRLPCQPIRRKEEYRVPTIKSHRRAADARQETRSR